MLNGPSLPPADDDLDLLHQRQYETRVYLRDEGHLLVRGVIVDDKPPGLFVDDDPEPLEIHRMEVELVISLADLRIVDAGVGFETHPYEACPTIADSYRQLIGLNIARGFNRRVRELFGGPRGCTHTTALLQAMAPAVHQSMWSVSMRRQRDGFEADDQKSLDESSAESAARQKRALDLNVNSCHIWDEDGERVRLINEGQLDHTPVSVRNRLLALDRDPDQWP